jgi:flagellar hook-basal body complex protein FliE
MSQIKEIGHGKQMLELPEAKQARSKSDFQAYLKACIEGVDHLQKEADRAAHEIATGKVENLHQAMIAMEKADVSFRLMVEARNRIVRVYEEIMKMQA